MNQPPPRYIIALHTKLVTGKEYLFILDCAYPSRLAAEQAAQESLASKWHKNITAASIHSLNPQPLATFPATNTTPTTEGGDA